MRFEQMSLFEKGSQQWSESHKANTEPDNRDEYEQFLDKFKTKKTTDDCYTPANIYDAVANWTAVEYGLDRAAFVRPFFPGGRVLLPGLIAPENIQNPVAVPVGFIDSHPFHAGQRLPVPGKDPADFLQN